MDRESSLRCFRCRKVCAGESLRVNDQLFHADCLVCLVCGKDLENIGFFVESNQYYCPEDFQERFGTKCFICHLFVEGEGINIGNNAYHLRCFVCTGCRNPFPPGEKVVARGNHYLCQQCSSKEINNDSRVRKLDRCAGCGEDIRSGQSLLALEKQWHLWCFTCTKCGCLLAGEYMGRDGKPYCEKDYQAEFGVTCAGCGGYIIGKVLQAGEKHYHPHCSRCARCHGVFGEGQEMFLQGSEIWHPDCSFAAAQNGELETDSVSYLSKLNHKHALQKRNLNSFGYCYNGFNLGFLVSQCEIKNKLFKFFFGGRCKCAAYWTSERRFQKLSLTMDYCVVFLDKQVWVWVSIRKT